MKAINRKLVLVLLVAVTGIFLFSASNAARAAMIESRDYAAEFEMYDIGVALNENEEAIAWRSYDGDNETWIDSGEGKLFSTLDSIKYGEVYPERISVSNIGQIDEYVRVSIYKYWVDENGEKATDIDPALIHIVYTEDENWILDEDYSKGPERTVYYYKKLLKGSESGTPETTSDLTESVYLDGSIKNYIIQTEETYDVEGYKVVTNIYVYDGRKFCIEARVDAIQTHNAEDAAMSAWGRKITVTDGELNLD